MTADLNISNCTEDDFAQRGRKPATLRDTGVERVLNRRLLTWTFQGSYGTGGTGFFAVQMAATQKFPKEWLILALWGSGSWLLLDGREVRDHYTTPGIPCIPFLNLITHKFVRLSRPVLYLVRAYQTIVLLFRPFYDEAWRKLSGARIIKVDITEKTSVVTLQKRTTKHILEIPQEGPILPSGEKWVIKGHHLDAWLVSRSGTIYC